MKVLIACEESQRVCIAFRERGHEAYSCDILPCSGGHPEWHIQRDVLEILDGNVGFKTSDNKFCLGHFKWDMIIAFPPCTYLTNTGNRWFNEKRYGKKAFERKLKRTEAIKFVWQIANANCPQIAIENPIGILSTEWRKATCLWLKNLPKLTATNIVTPEIIKYKNGKGTDTPWHMDTINLPPDERAKVRSKTFPGIARAMAEQWG